MKNVVLLAAVLPSFALAACATAPHRVDQEELSPDYSGRTYSDLLILGAYEDRSFRVSSETAFAEELKAKGVTATPSYPSIPDLKSLENEAMIKEALASMSHDALLTVSTIDEGYDYEYDDYLETRGLVYLLGGEPGAGTDMGSFISWAGSGSYSLLIALWDTGTLEPVWQVTTNSQSTGSESGDLKALSEFVVETMRAKGLVQ